MTIQGEIELSGQSDGALAARVATGSQAALETLLQRHAGMVLNVTRRVLGNSPDCDDAFQAVFMLLASKASTLTQRDSIADWLHFAAVNISRRALRSSYVRRQREEEGAAMHAAQFHDDASVRGQWAEAKAHLDEELHTLPEHYRTALILHHLQHHSVEQTAGIMQKPVGTVAGWLSRARELLREKLTRKGIAIPAVAFAALLSRDASAAPAAELMSQALSAATSVASGSLPAAHVTPRATALFREELQSMYWNSNSKLAVVAMLVLLLCGSVVLFVGRKTESPETTATVTKDILPVSAPVAPKKKPIVEPVLLPAPVPADEWTELIGQLSVNDPEKRVEIEKTLRDNFAAAKTALEKATKHDDPEVSSRASKIIAIKKHEPLVNRIKNAQFTTKTLDFEFSVKSTIEALGGDTSGRWKGYLNHSRAQLSLNTNIFRVNGTPTMPNDLNEMKIIQNGNNSWMEFGAAEKRTAIKINVHEAGRDTFDLIKATQDLCNAVEFTGVSEIDYMGEPVYVLTGVVSEAMLFGLAGDAVAQKQGPSVLDNLRTMKKARAHVSRNDLMVRKAEVWDAADNLLAEVEIKNLKINPVFAQNEFDYVPPAGAKVFDTSKMSTAEELQELSTAMGIDYFGPPPANTAPAPKK